jgi:hypothetical protein
MWTCYLLSFSQLILCSQTFALEREVFINTLLCLLLWQGWLSKAAGCSDYPESHQQLLRKCDVLFTQTNLLCVVWHGEHWDLHCRISKAGLIEYGVNQMAVINQQAAGAGMSCIKDSKRSLVWFVLELIVRFNSITFDDRMGHICKKCLCSVHLYILLDVVWMTCRDLGYFFLRGTCRWNYCIYLNLRGSSFTAFSFQQNTGGDHV